jgi:hypothetical protein
MSAKGQNLPRPSRTAASAFTPKAAATFADRRVRFGPQADLCTVERSKDTETLPLRPFYRVYIVDTCGYDFRKGHHSNDNAACSNDFRSAITPVRTQRTWISPWAGVPQTAHPPASINGGGAAAGFGGALPLVPTTPFVPP